MQRLPHELLHRISTFAISTPHELNTFSQVCFSFLYALDNHPTTLYIQCSDEMPDDPVSTKTRFHANRGDLARLVTAQRAEWEKQLVDRVVERTKLREDPLFWIYMCVFLGLLYVAIATSFAHRVIHMAVGLSDLLFVCFCLTIVIYIMILHIANYANDAFGIRFVCQRAVWEFIYAQMSTAVIRLRLRNPRIFARMCVAIVLFPLICGLLQTHLQLQHRYE